MYLYLYVYLFIYIYIYLEIFIYISISLYNLFRELAEPDLFTKALSGIVSVNPKYAAEHQMIVINW